jgi:hypothetical protein
MGSRIGFLNLIDCCAELISANIRYKSKTEKYISLKIGISFMNSPIITPDEKNKVIPCLIANVYGAKYHMYIL